MTATATKPAPSREVRLVRDGEMWITATNSRGKTTTEFYAFDPISSDWGEGYRLQKLAWVGDFPNESVEVQAEYNVCLDGGKSTCDCPDHTYRGHERPCKHIAAMLALKSSGKI